MDSMQKEEVTQKDGLPEMVVCFRVIPDVPNVWNIYLQNAKCR